MLATLLATSSLAVATQAADMNKTLRVVFPTAESGFDPQANSDLYSADIMRAIFEPPLRYDYLARPVKFVPNTAEAMPVFSDGGRTVTVKIKPGIFFKDDPAFGGKKRELVAEDYIFGIKRVWDPKIISPRQSEWSEFEILGAQEFYEHAKSKGIDFNKTIEGLRALDRYTIQIKTRLPRPTLIEQLAFNTFTPIAREVYEKYKDPSNKLEQNPVGTGPYYLKEWKRASKMVLEANPYYRGITFPTQSDDPSDQAVIEEMRGKKLPAIGRVIVNVIEESNPRLLAFKGQSLDVLGAVPVDLVDGVIQGGRLIRELAEQQVKWVRGLQPALSYTYFNMDDPVLGGYTNERIALRRAMIMAFNNQDYIKVVFKGHAEAAGQFIPPPNTGHDPSAPKGGMPEPAVARALLDRYGYKDRDGDGYRENPDGTPLVITKSSATRELDRQEDEIWKKSMDAIGIKIQFNKAKWPDLLKEGKAGRLQMWGVGWISALPDGGTFAGLLYSGRIGQSNYSRFKNKEFDEAFDQAMSMQQSPERTHLFRKMNDIMSVYGVWEKGIYRYQNTLLQPWVQGYKKMPFLDNPWWFWDIDASKQVIR
ncbi:MAG: Periplasmic dipeptide transport protein [Pseudomonadota bacterium]